MAELSSQTLHIVARELNTELNEARAALELFGDQQDNVALLRRCNEHLHAVHGALRVSEVYGAALLAEEMGQVLQYLVDNFAEKRHLAEGLDALMRSMVQLPTYLERVLSGGRDMALVLLPLLNDLRAVRGHALLSEGTLLLLNLSSDQQASPTPAAPGEGALTVAHWARKLRTRFQLGLLGWIKGERVEQNLEVLARAAERLEQVATTQPVFQLWWVVGALIEAMREGGLEGSASIKRLLGQADRDMRRLYEQGESRYADAPSLELLNNLLYYVARAKSSGPRVSAVRASFRLSELLPVDDQVEQARESLSAPSVKLMKTVAAAIKEDLGRVKDALDLFVRRGGTQVEELSPQLELLKKIGDTLGVLGLGELRDKVQGETTDLQAIIAQQAPVNEGVLLRMAATLIKVEDSLDEQLVGMIVPTGDSQSAPAKPAGPDDIEFRQVTEAVLRECIVNMARIKEAIAQSMDRTREGQSIDQIPVLVRGITAGLTMLGKTRAAEIMDGIDKALAQFVRSDGMTLPPEAVDRLADGIVAVEYYMETLQAGRADPWYMLDNAETCLRYLAETQPVPIGDGFPQTPDHAHTVVIEPLSQTVAAPTEQERTAVLDRSAQVVPLPKPAPQPVSAPAPQPAAAVPPAMVKPTDGEIDPEFLEIFIEEAKDEIAKLEKYFPMWDQNPQDQDSLVHVRRSFHTLKGSGRMVGAQLIGEFAWSIESLLNRVINKTLDRTPDIMGVMRSAVAAVPQLVEQIETGRAPAADVGYIMSQANNLSGARPQAPAAAQAAPAPAPAAVAPPPAAPAAPAAAPAQKKTLAPVMDPVLHEIYAKETAGHLATIRKFIAACDLSTPPYPVTEDLHRSCHTLSGTAKTAGAIHGTTVADPLNRYIRKLYDNSAGLTNNGLEALKDSAAAIQQVVDHINEDASFFSDHPRIVARLQELEAELDQDIARLGETMDVGAEATRAIPVLRDVEPAPAAPGAPSLEDTPEVIMDDPDAVTNVFEDAAFPSVAPPRGPSADEPAIEHGEEITIESVDVIEMPSTDAGDLEALEWSYKNFPTEEPTVRAPKLDAEAVPAQAEEIASDAPVDDGGIVVEETGVSETIDASVAADEGFVVEDFAGLAETNRVPVLAAIHELPQQAIADVPVVVDAVEDVSSEEIVIEVGEIPLESADADSMPQLDDGSETRQSVALSIVPPSVPEPVAEALQEEPAAQVEEAPPVDDVAIEAVAEPVVEAIAEPVVQAAEPAVEAAPQYTAPAPAVAAVAAAPEEPEELDDDFDPDVAAIFTEEAAELLETADSSLSAWSRDRANKALVFELKRVLHTLKGGARMAGIRAMGDLSHELETLMELVEAGQVPGDQPVFDALQTSLDTLHRMRDTVNQGGRCARPRELISRIRVLSGHEQPAPEPVAAAAPEVAAPAIEPVPPVAVAEAAPVLEDAVATDVSPEESMEIEVEFGADELGAAAPRESVRIEDPASASMSQAAAFDVAAVAPELLPEASVAVAEPELIPAPALPPGREPQVQERQEFARVDADLLDTLLNNAGEVSIFRSRLEQQVGSIEFNLAELGRTVTRLKDQLRKLELETEAQILHRRQEEHPNRADFDPLELDRYSTIQQLTRAFAESVSDVGSIEGLLENLTREGQNLLLQQARVVTELQNGLMRTRMVPFQRHVQRLSRLVRQVATEVGKKAELVVVGAAGELDRQVLDRMLPPFEHMLRNSIVHGIETPEERVAKGKSENGTIRVGLHREGAEMVIILEDDGRGIDVNAVRERARSRGLLQPGRVLTDEEAMQLILEPGFSTASSVTQHAGRGVGMDVVVTEIKKLGGALFTESQPGQGVKFTIRLPFTLAITQALIVRTGEELYALPLPSVEGVARVPRSEVEKHLAEETPTFNYGGQVYRFQHLGAFVGGGASTLPDGDVSVPLILIRAGEHSTAIVPDELVGSREMVVKAVGPQIATIRGISGATIMGDGRIVIILDMGALVRSEWRGRGQVEGPREDRRTFALVVDDSITVRRVTQRLLERNGMRVMTAKDGVDALSIIQEHLPDVILLDIEMPRMDGYEFATHVRADARTADIPIVMITSRTGEKHRARAIEIGVNDYLGKPYQENQLLDAIEPLVEARRRHRRMA